MTAKKTTTKKATNRTVRTAAERIADLQAEIERIRQRDTAKQLRASDDGRAFIVAIRATNKALDAVKEAGNSSMVEVLTTARSVLAEELDRMGLRVPAPKPRASKSTAA